MLPLNRAAIAEVLRFIETTLAAHDWPWDADLSRVHFMRPAMAQAQRDAVVGALLQDIRGARRRLALVSAWFTDDEIARAFIASPTPPCCKCVVLNRADLGRERRSVAYPILHEYFARGLVTPALAERHDSAHHSVGAPEGAPEPDWGITILGSDDWAEGVMHHKCIVADDAVWTGSYNYTWQARKNYETLLRINDCATAELFWREVGHLQEDAPLWERRHGTQFAAYAGRFRCCSCLKLAAPDEGAEQSRGESNPICQACEDRNAEARERLRLSPR